MTQEEFFKRYKYDVTEDRIGGGGFGTVYKAYDTTLHHDVAIKVSEVKTINGKTFSLRDEVKALTHVPEHPNIANYEKDKLFTFKTPQGVFDYAVMQYYPDGNLNNAIKQGLTAEQKEDIATQLLEGIVFLHEHKVVHRDLKPGNILIVRNGDRVIPLITDFGLSKAADTGDGSVFTNSLGAGTPRYSSPEQLQGEPLRFNTDLWSYGSILYEIFTGEQLFTAGSGAANTAQADMEIYNKIVNGNVKNLDKMPETWRRVAERCLVVNPDHRARSVDELMDLLTTATSTVDKTLVEHPTPSTTSERTRIDNRPANVQMEVTQLENDKMKQYMRTKPEYVDLGLPSGTKWKSVNEAGSKDGFYIYDEAILMFGNQLPTKEQWVELLNECSWTPTVYGQQVTGPNGNMIYLPAAGFRGMDDEMIMQGHYWSSTPHSSARAWWQLDFSGYPYMIPGDCCEGFSVRLVQGNTVAERCLVADPLQQAKNADELMDLLATATSTVDKTLVEHPTPSTTSERTRIDNRPANVQTEVTQLENDKMKQNMRTKLGAPLVGEQNVNKERSIGKTIVLSLFAVFFLFSTIEVLYHVNEEMSYWVGACLCAVYCGIFLFTLKHDNFAYNSSDKFVKRILFLILSLWTSVMFLGGILLPFKEKRICAESVVAPVIGIVGLVLSIKLIRKAFED